MIDRLVRLEAVHTGRATSFRELRLKHGTVVGKRPGNMSLLYAACPDPYLGMIINNPSHKEASVLELTISKDVCSMYVHLG